MSILWTNNAASVLAGGITAGTLSISVMAGQGDRFPAVAAPHYFMATLVDTSGNREIVKVTARTPGSNTMTIERAQEGTSARSFATGDIVELRITKNAMDHLSKAADINAQHYVCDASAADQGATTNSASLKSLVDALGATEEATIDLPHTGTGDTTTYTVGTNLTIPATVTLRVHKGARVSPSGGVTLTVNGIIQAGAYTIFAGAGTVTVSTYPQDQAWWGNAQRMDGNFLVQSYDTDLATFSLPANTTISSFAKTLLDDTSAAAVRTTLGIEAAITGTKLDDMATPDDNTDLNASSTRHGLLPKLANSEWRFLNGKGAWAYKMGLDAITEGAVGDGVANDQPALQALATALGTRGGGVILLPKGTYKLNSSLRLPTNVILQGEGRTVSKIFGNLNSALIRGTGGATGRNYRIGIRDLWVDNTSKTNVGGIGIDFRNVTEAVCWNVYISNCERGLSLYTDVGYGCYYNEFYSLEFDTCTTGVLFASNENHLIFPRFISCTTGIDWQSNSNSTVIGPSIESFTTGINISAGALGGLILGGRYENTPTSGTGINFAISADTAKILILNPHFVGLSSNIAGTGVTTTKYTYITGGGSS